MPLPTKIMKIAAAARAAKLADRKFTFAACGLRLRRLLWSDELLLVDGIRPSPRPMPLPVKIMKITAAARAAKMAARKYTFAACGLRLRRLLWIHRATAVGIDFIDHVLQYLHLVK